MRTLVKMPDPRNVVAGGTFTLELPVGLTYDRLQLHLTNITDAQITNIELIANGKTIQQYADGTELENINAYYGRTAHTGVLTLFFERPEFVTLEDQRACALGTADVQTLTLKGDIAGAASNPAIVAYALRSAPQPMGLITKFKRYPMSFSGSGVVDFNQIVRAGRIMAVHFKKSDVTEVVMEADSRKFVDLTKAGLEAVQKDSGRVPVTASFTHVDFCLDGDLSQALVASPRSSANPGGIVDLRTLLTLGTSGAVVACVEYLDGFGGI